MLLFENALYARWKLGGYLMTKVVKDKIAEVALSFIVEPKIIDRMEISSEGITELAQSISEIGLLQPILLRVDGDCFEIIAGHRRFLAHKLLGLKKIKAVIREMTDKEAAIARATENLQRENLTPIEEATIFLNLHEKHGIGFEDIGARVGKTPGLVKRRMDLLKMPPNLQQALHKKQISIGVAEELWPITDASTLDYYLSFALDGGCTVTVARQWCKDWKDQTRRRGSDNDGGAFVSSPYEPRPTFMTCDVCQGPVELGKDVIIRACPECNQLIKEALKGV